MTALVQINQGTAPAGSDGDTVRSAFAKVNSNALALGTQVPLVTTYLPDGNATFDASYMGKRVCLLMSGAGRTVWLPRANSVGSDQCILLWNLGYGVAIGLQGSDGSEITQMFPGDWILYVSDGNAYWHVVQRGRNGWNENVGGNLVVNGALTVSGGIAGNLSATGKISGVNNPNLQLNGSGEFGGLNWSLAAFSAIWDTASGYGPYIGNPAAMAVGSAAQQLAPVITVGASVPMVLSADVKNMGTAGTCRLQLTAWNSSGAYITDFISQVIPNGTNTTRFSLSGMTPAGTASIRANLYFSSDYAAPAFGVSLRNIKVEQGTVPSLYSQEASVAYLQGAPALSGRPTFAGKTPWDSGNLVSPWSTANLANPATTDTTQTVTGAKTYSGASTFLGSAAFYGWGGGSYTTSQVNIATATGLASIGFNSNGIGGVFRLDTGAAGFQFLNYNTTAYMNITCSSVAQTSDEALKTGITPLSGVLQKLRGKRAVSYALKADPDRQHIGVIAQEWQADFPELVVDAGVDIDEDGDFVAHQYDKAGNEIFGPNGKPQSRRALGFNYSNASALALQGVIDLEAALSAALARIEALEAK